MCTQSMNRWGENVKENVGMENLYLNQIVLDKINKKSNSISEKCERKINYSSLNSFFIFLYLSTGGGRQTEVTRCFRGRPAAVTGATRT